MKNLNLYIFEDSPVSSKVCEMVCNSFQQNFGTGSIRTFSKCADVDKIDFYTPAFILADIKLSDGDFTEVIPEIRRRQRWMFPIFLISGTDRSEDYFKLGADEFFLKPINTHVVLNRMVKYHYEILLRKRTAKMYSYLLPLVIRFLLVKLVSGLPMASWKDEAKAWVFKTVPGSWADEAAWAVVDGAWDVILGEVLKQAPQGLADSATMDEAWGTVANIQEALHGKVSA